MLHLMKWNHSLRGWRRISLLVELLYDVDNLLFKHLAYHCYKMISTCNTPAMITGSILHIYKGNNKDKCNPPHYSGTTSVIGKVFERLLKEWLESQNCPDFSHRLQCRFRKEHGASFATYVSKAAISYYQDIHSNRHVALLDNEKAFNGIWYGGLLVTI